MTLHAATKVVIITERLIAEPVFKIIQECGATGYTFTPAGGKGSRNVRSTSERATVVSEFANIKIEVIVHDLGVAEAIMDTVAGRYFQNYSGITYTEQVQILRPAKFHRS